MRNLSDVQFPFQLSMFEPAGKIWGETDPMDLAQEEDKEDLYQSKLDEAKSTNYHLIYGEGIHPVDEAHSNNPRLQESLYSRLQQEGIQDPVSLEIRNTPFSAAFGRRTSQSPASVMLGNGHHRVVSAVDMSPSTEVPVTWEDHREADMPLGERYRYLQAMKTHPGREEAIASIRPSRLD